MPEISDATVSRYLKKHGICSRIAAQKTSLELRNLHRIGDLCRTIFIHEFHIQTDDGSKKRVKRLANSRYSGQNIDNYKSKNRLSLTAVCFFSSKGSGPIRPVFGKMNAESYLDYLIEMVLPYARANFGEKLFILQYNAPIHKARIVTE